MTRQKNGPSAHYFEGDNLLHLDAPRPEPPPPEPPDVSRAISRDPQPWEAQRIIEARQRERTREAAIFRGVGS